jgi:nucleotide-binding universal stress UspA family protein
MQTILVPTDFSPHARNAASHAAELAKTYNAKLFLFHAYMLPTPVSEVPYVMVTVDELQKENEGLIRREAEALNKEHNLEIEWLVRIGIPSDEIKVLTEEREIDLVVMGMKGVGGLDKIIGSTTVNAIRKVKTPILVVPTDSTYQPVKNVVVSIDFARDITQSCYQPLINLAQKFGANVHIIHIHKMNEVAKAEESVRRKAIDTALGSMPHEFVELEDASVVRGINDYIERHSSELLVMIAHKHSFFERLFTKNQTTTMAYQTKIPLLVLHEKP